MTSFPQSRFKVDLLETPYITIHKEDRLMYCVYKENLDITLDVAKACVKARLDFSRGIRYPQLVDARGMRSITKEARAYLASDGVDLVVAGAIITGSPLTNMLGNMFLTVNKPPVPTRLFADEKAAREWLKRFMT